MIRFTNKKVPGIFVFGTFWSNNYIDHELETYLRFCMSVFKKCCPPKRCEKNKGEGAGGVRGFRVNKIRVNFFLTKIPWKIDFRLFQKFLAKNDKKIRVKTFLDYIPLKNPCVMVGELFSKTVIIFVCFQGILVKKQFYPNFFYPHFFQGILVKQKVYPQFFQWILVKKKN